MNKVLADYSWTESNATVTRLSHVFTSLNAPFEMAYFKLAPGASTIEHSHVDKEIFICLDGSAKIRFDKELVCSLGPEEIVFVDRHRIHKIMNENDCPITLMSISWEESENQGSKFPCPIAPGSSKEVSTCSKIFLL